MAKIRIRDDVSREEMQRAERAASQHPPELITSLRYTEHNPEWVLLYDHARVGQVRPEDLKRMRREDLQYLAGMTRTHGELDEGQATRLAGNVARAVLELQRRQTRNVVVWTTSIGAGAALIGAVVGALVGRG